MDNYINSIDNRLKSLRKEVLYLKKNWLGKSGEKHYQMYKEYENNLNRMVSSLRNYRKDLLIATQQYEAMEGNLKSQNGKLDTNII